MTNRKSQDVNDERKVFNKLSERDIKVKLNDTYYKKYYDLANLKYCEKPARLLEVGCGEGIHCNNLRKLNYTVTGIDISDSAIKKAKDRYSNTDIVFKVMDAEKLDFRSGTYDIVLFWMTLHHFYYSGLEPVVSESLRVLKPEGRIILVEPNNNYLYNNIAYTTAHYINKFYKGGYLENTFTSNEHSLHPNKINIINDQLKLSEPIAYVNYINAIAVNEKSPSPRPFVLGRKILDVVSNILPKPYKHDTFISTYTRI